jgi:hypothetical protein
MTNPIITAKRERELVTRLSDLAARRAKEEVEIRAQHAQRLAQLADEHQRARRGVTTDFETRHATMIAEYQQAREAAFSQYENQGFALARAEQHLEEQAKEKHEELLEDARTYFQHRHQELENECQEREIELRQQAIQFQQLCDARASEFGPLVAKAQAVVRKRASWPEEPMAPPATQPGMLKEVYLERVPQALARAHERLVALEREPYARFLEDGWPVLIFIFVALAAAYPLWLFVAPHGLVWFGLAAALAPLLVALATRQAIRPIARKRTVQIVPEFRQAMAQAEAELAAAREAGHREAEKSQRRLVKRREKELGDAQVDFERTRQEENDRYAAKRQKTAADFSTRRRTLEATHGKQIEQVEAGYPPQIEKLELAYEERMVALSDKYKVDRAAEQERFEKEWNQLAKDWQRGLAESQAAITEMNAFCEATFPAWQAVDWSTWRPGQAASDAAAANGDGQSPGEPPASESLAALQFGQFQFEVETPAAAQSEPGQAVSTTTFPLPAVLAYPDCPSLLLKATGEGRDTATRVLQNVMLRLATSFPPGKVRFTIIDPVGLGQNFSAFMHLADYDERLVNNRIWTESAHIHQRLADLTEHMENVIQKYLRNEFASIQEYNDQAGEVAEAFQILVIANFPAGLSEEAARRLVSIAKSGARCGVYTLISTDDKLRLPRNFDLADLENQAATLVWDEAAKRFVWKDDVLGVLPLQLELPPDDEQFTEIVRAVGKLAKASARVEVPFESVVPPMSDWWSADSRESIDVPLGRAGAKKLQYMRLGKGTSQHVLISGKTGSGKSTLLNATITNLALHYSPDELQFYLIDFKKGVEFKAYAAQRLPHARVIAIESEREFGMSVLERLDQELRRRGDLFRKLGVQDVKGYRSADPEAVMPRILLVIDEFQEFFTSDDRISHDSSLLLDRLVRQGRAFGIHVLLGSQTLAGAYSLARSTIGQMAVRIALQCSESDAHLILSEDNTAARLLSRPGEAIYNDANGLFEGNHPFQVVWLSDHQRESYLERIAALARVKQLALPTPIVFEGNVAADPADNDLLRSLMFNPAPVAVPVAPRAWLGAAVAIKDPTSAIFRPQGGANMLIVGQQEELALGVLATSVLALSAQVRPANSSESERLRSFYVLDGTRAESPHAGYWPKLLTQLGVDGQIATPRDAPEIVNRLAEEVERRMASGEQLADPIFLVIDDLARFRDLKKSEDFSFDDEGAGAGKQLTKILREGPNVGMHAIVWCDSYNNVNRWLDRQTLRDFDLRVLFQMSAADSSNLMDSPAAGRLGAHLAIAYSEEQGVAEKFRPYGLPSAEWLVWVAERLATRGGAIPQVQPASFPAATNA